MSVGLFLLAFGALVALAPIIDMARRLGDADEGDLLRDLAGQPLDRLLLISAFATSGGLLAMAGAALLAGGAAP